MKRRKFLVRLYSYKNDNGFQIGDSLYRIINECDFNYYSKYLGLTSLAAKEISPSEYKYYIENNLLDRINER